MKICLINNLYAPYNHGGAEKVCAQMAKDFKSQNNEVFIITTKPKHPNLEKNVSDNIYYINSEFYNLKDKSIPSRLFWHLGNIFSFKKYFRVLNILIQEKPDLIISHNLMGVGFMAAKAISKSNVKHHHFLHDIQLLHPSGLIIYGKEQKLKQLPAKLYRFFTRKMINSPELVISPSAWLIKEHQKFNFFKDSKIEIRKFSTMFLKNIDNENAKNTNNLLKDSDINNEKIKKLLFAGQIESHKGIIFLITAFLNLASSDMTLKIAGSGSLLSDAKNLARNDKRISFFGILNQTELSDIMNNSDALIVPSLCYENSPLIINEAKSLNLKVIASNIGGISESISKIVFFSPFSKVTTGIQPSSFLA